MLRDRRFSVVAALLSAVIAAAPTLSGCGGGKEKEARKLLPGQISLHETTRECLTEVGVQIAIAPRDLAFFRDARAADDVAEVGSKYDHKEKAMVRLLASRSGGAKEWMLWYSEPEPALKGPGYIVDHPNGFTSSDKSLESTYVAFKVKPKLSFRREIHRCVGFPLNP